METTTNNNDGFRLYLQNELIRRCKLNPQYSLRSFAKFLNVSSSALSAMLKGIRPITARTRKLFGLQLGLGLEEIEKFNSDKKDRKNYGQLTLDAFALISDWYYYAILELLRVDGFKSNAAWVANCLGISKSEANIAIERLIRLEMIEVDTEGNWKDVSGGSTTNIEEGLTSVASKQLQQQILEKAITALQEIDVSRRDHTSMTVAINTKDVMAVKEMTKQFRRNLTSFLERPGSQYPNEVYHLGIAFYPVSNIDQGE